MLGTIIALLFSFNAEALENCHRYQPQLVTAIETALDKKCADIKEEDLETIEVLELQNLELQDFRHDEISDIFHHFTRVTHVHLQGNFLVSPITANKNPFEKMRKLEIINMAHNSLDNIFMSKWLYFAQQEAGGSRGVLDNLKSVNFFANPFRTVMDNQNYPSIVVDGSTKHAYKTGIGERWIVSHKRETLGLNPDDDFKSHAYIQVGDIVYKWEQCHSKNNCDQVAKNWAMNLIKGNRLLIQFETYNNFIKSVDVIRNKERGEELNLFQSISTVVKNLYSVPDCLVTDGFPLNSYSFCRYNFGLESCIVKGNRKILSCRRYLLNRNINDSNRVQWKSANDYCGNHHPYSPCPIGWNQDWHKNGGSVKPPVIVFFPY